MTKNTRRVVFSLGRAGFVFFLLGLTGLVFVFFLFGLKVGLHLDTYPEKIAALPGEVGRWLTAEGLPDEERMTPLPTPPASESPSGLPAAEKELPAPPPAPPPPEALLNEPPFLPAPETPETIIAGQEAGKQPPAAPALPAKDEKSAVAGISKNIPDRYVVQIGAFKERDKAEKLRGRMRSRGYQPAIETGSATAGNVVWYRVVVGNYPDMEAARQAMARIKKRHPDLDCLVKPRERPN
jgi:cell division protein FtsN